MDQPQVRQPLVAYGPLPVEMRFPIQMFVKLDKIAANSN